MRRVRWALPCLMVLMIAISPPLAGSIRAAPMATSTPAEPRLHAAIAAAIPPDTGRGVIRLPSVRLDDTGDLTVVVALRERDNLADFRTAAGEDVFQILRAVYSTADTGVRTVTVVGTYSVTGTYGARETRVLRVVLPATTAKAIDWSTASPDRLFTAAETYRFYPPFGDELGNPVVLASASASDPVISSPVDIGGRNLFLRCIGSGSPTVILESGYGDNGTIWAPVQIHAAEFVRVCSYDRAGLERSDPPDHYPRTGAEVVADLHAALQKDGVKPPYLLVGQSQGAIFSRLFAATYPGEVAGLLLLDPWPEAFDTKLEALVTGEQWRHYLALLAAEPDNEVIDFPATYAELQKAGPLPDVPLLVLSHGLAPNAAGYPPGWPVTRQEQLWQTLQQAMATLTPRGEQRVVADSGDMIQLAKPEVVVAALRDMVDEWRG